MRVDRSGGKGFIAESSRTGKETSIQKKGGKVKLTAGDQDDVQITQSRNSLKIQINGSNSVLLNPEESKNLEIVSGGGKISVDRNVTILIKGRATKAQDSPTSKIDSFVASGRKEETQLKADITRKFLSSELRDVSSAQTVPIEQVVIQNPAASTLPLDVISQKTVVSSAVQVAIPELQGIENDLSNPDLEKMSPEQKAIFVQTVMDRAPATNSDESNRSNSVLLNPKESKNHEMVPTSGNISVDQNVTRPTKGRAPTSQDSPTSKIDPSAASGRKEETQLAADITRTFLSSELRDVSTIQTVLMERDSELKGAMPGPPGIQNDLSKLHLEEMSPEQKSMLVQTAMDRPPVTSSDEVIHSILLSAETPEEFNHIVDEAGGKNIVAKFQNEEMKVLWDQLVGAYDRTDLALNFDEATKTRGVLLGDGAQLEKYLPKPEQPLLLQMNGHIELNQVGRQALVCVTLENAVRENAGLPLIIPGDLREKVFDILKNPDLSSEELPPLLEGLRKEVGLSEYQMREIVSLPMVDAFESVIKDLTNFQAPKVESFQKQIREAIDANGPQSVAVKIAKAEMSEFLDTVDPQIGLFRDLKAVASEIFSGPADTQVKIDRLVHSILNELALPTTQLTSLVEPLGKGSVVFENGKLHECLQNLEQLNIPELKNFAGQGIHFLRNLPVLITLAPQIPAPEFKSFQFLDRLQNGTFQKQITDFGQAIQQYRALPAVQQTVTQLNHWRSEYSGASGPRNRASVLEEGRKLLDDLTNGMLLSRWNELSTSVRDLKLDSRIGDVTESIRIGRDLIVSFRNGHFVQMLAALNQRMAGSPAILQIIQQGLHLTTSGTNFFRGLMNREWEKPIAQALKKSPGSRELREAESIFSDTLNLFVPLESIDNLSPFLQYQKQFGLLRDVTLMNDLIQQYRAKAREIL